MRSSTQLSTPPLLRRPQLYARRSRCKSLVPSWSAFVREEHAVAEDAVATPLPPKVAPSLDFRALQARMDRRFAIPKLPKRPFLTKNPIFLRDACSCPKCVDPSTTQKLFETADIPLDIRVQTIEYLTGDAGLRVTWQNDIPGYDNHTSTYNKSFFTKYTSTQARLRATFNTMTQTPWDRMEIGTKNLTLDYDAYMNSSSTLHRALCTLYNYGIFFLRSVPSEPTSVNAVATRIGPLQNTFYGPTWDVRSVPSAKNVADTSGHLGFHMDLLYMADPPKVQILHCMKASTHGGESLFSDALAAVVAMLQPRPGYSRSHLSPLFEFPVTYRYKNDGQCPYYPGVGKITAINWSPPFQAPFENHVTQAPLRYYLKVAKDFKARVEDDAALFETKLDEGTCVVFDNRRVLHARKAFSSEGGERWLRGAYVGGDAFMSRLRMLKEEHGIIEDVVPEAEATV
ncbi:MAG: hypothetical protein FRX48_06654 [Lasallia pustulata]|uniref:Gamma-butyrobetaine dioxygenase n=1 Tax=Lasallia pustulata TaxID=136370 RepID=A0A5M8PM46_9LECA|nr:MAG: hypothetical protein FRX48_06654 [Lasallia pustulata]